MLRYSEASQQPIHVRVPTTNTGQYNPLCPPCQSIFSPTVYTGLKQKLSLGETSYAVEFVRKTSEIYGSIQGGCRFCALLGNAILTRGHLDYWYDLYNRPQSDGDSSREEVDEEDEDEDEQDEDDESDDGDINGYSDRPGSPTIESLDCLAEANCEIRFSRPKDGLFDLVTALITITNTPDETLPEMTGEKRVEVSLETTSAGNSLSTVMPPTMIQKEADFDSLVATSRSWLNMCSTGHNKHCTPPDQSFCPTRLIDVESSRLLPNARSMTPLPPYIALSYVWGKNQTYTLTKSSYPALPKALHQESIPQTVQDAMKLTRSLGFRYIWVDALCIIQDSAEDMTAELATMAEVYKKAAFTIMAASASSCTEGFLLRSPDDPHYFVKPFSLPFRLSSNTQEDLTLGYRASYRPAKDPINSRGWTLQERLLSPRILMFAHDGPKWICNTHQVNPASRSKLNMFPTLLHPTTWYTHFEAPILDQAALDRQKLYEAWTEIKEEYSQRVLSFGGDKLSAVSAIASEISLRSDNTGQRKLKYLAGMWEEFLFSDLLWHREQFGLLSDDLLRPEHKSRRRPKEYRAPSWSWASVDGPISSPKIDADDGDGGFSEPFHFRILNCTVEQSTAFEYGPVKGGKLEVEGRCVELAWRNSGGDDNTAGTELTVENDGHVYVVGECTFDALEPDLSPDTRVICLAMSLTSRNRELVPAQGIVLVPHKGNFRRVGFFSVYTHKLFEGDKRRLVIV